MMQSVADIALWEAAIRGGDKATLSYRKRVVMRPIIPLPKERRGAGRAYAEISARGVKRC